jgi:hypothetical protein
MRKSLFLISLLLFCQTAFGAILIKDEGTDQGFVWNINFTGAGVSCSVSGSDGTCTITSGGGSGTMTTVKESDSQVGGADIVTLDFGAGFDVAESPDTEVQITLDLTEKQVNLTTEVTGELPDANVVDTLTASNYLPLAGGTLTGEVVVDNLGLEFTAGDDHANCSAFAATGGGIFYDDSEGKFKKCQDNTLTDLDTTGSETNDLESIATSAGDGEIFVGTGANAGAYITGLAACADDEKIEYVPGSPDTFTCEAIGSLVDADVSDTLTASTSTTAAADDNDTSIATTAFVQQEINGAGGTNLSCSGGQCNVDDAFILNTGDVGTGTYDFGGADHLELPNSATYAPGTTTGRLGLDTTITSHDGYYRYYDGATEMIVVAMPAADLTTTDNHVVAYDSAKNGFNMEAQAGGGGSVSHLFTLTPQKNEPTTSNLASLDLRNNIPVLDFDDTTDESSVFAGVMTNDYANGGLTVVLEWAATTATTGDVVWEVSIERWADDANDIDSDSFAAANFATCTTANVSGEVDYCTITFTDGADMDSLTDGEGFRLKVSRDADDTNGTDNLSGDAELARVHGYNT